MAWIYRIVRLNTGKCYVGHTSQEPEVRWRAHRTLLKQGKHHARYLQNAWRKDGPLAFKFEIIEECEEATKVEREQYWIDNLDSHFNYGRVAGSRKGQKYSDEHKAKIAAKAMGNQRTKGRKWSAEEHKKYSKARKNQPQSEAQRASTLRSLELGRQANRANKPGWIPMHRIGAKDSAATIEKRRASRLAFEAAKQVKNWWITDGVNEQMISSTDPIPLGWRRGRQPKIGEVGRSRIGEKRSDQARAKMSKAHTKSSPCTDCGVDTAPPIGKPPSLGRWEYYMVRDDIWEAFGVGNGFLCVGCLEERLGRKLTPQDFSSVTINHHPNPYDTPRLASRKAGVPC